MPKTYDKALRLNKLERTDVEIKAIIKYSLLNTNFSFMLYDVGGLMFKACGLLVDTLYPDYWRSWTVYKEEWDAYENAAHNITSLPEHVIELIKMSTIFNSCTNAIELRSNTNGFPFGMENVINALKYKSFESAGYGVVAIYAYMYNFCFLELKN